MSAVMTEQRSAEWFAQRAQLSITGSMVGAVLGVNPHAKRKDALREKVRERLGAEREFQGNAATEYGTRHEPDALAAYSEHIGLDVIEVGLMVHPELDWIGASPDGLVGDGDEGLVEIKCPFSKELYNLGDKPMYYAQIQLQLAVTGRKWCDFVVWTPETIAIERVDADPHWLADNMETLLAFHEELREIVASPELSQPHLDPLEVPRDDFVFSELEDQYVELDRQSKDIAAQLKKCKAALIEEAAGVKSRGQKLLVYPVERTGAVDYPSLIKELMPDADVDAYRKSSSVSWAIKVK